MNRTSGKLVIWRFTPLVNRKLGAKEASNPRLKPGSFRGGSTAIPTDFGLDSSAPHSVGQTIPA